MTRFARSRGSKASNERTPEDSTPWEVMKEQLLQSKKDNEESKNRKEAEQKRIENYENFLKERKVLKRKAIWCDFPEAEQNNGLATNSELLPKTKKKNKKGNSEIPNSNENDNMSNEIVIKSGDNVKKAKKKKKKSNALMESHTSKEQIGVNDDSNEIQSNDIEKSKKKKKKFQTQMDSLNMSTDTNDVTEPPSSTQDIDAAESIDKKSKKKNKRNQKSQPSGALQNYQPNITEDNIENGQKFNNNKQLKQQELKHKKNKKFLDGKPVRRKQINDRSFQLIINGKDIELVRFDGFPVMKKDAERLEELKSSMIKKGIPKSEVQRTIKLERRRAEKALARVKRDVCYNCRKGGHVLSDCPELKSKIPGADGADGVCFKCGSTEHRQFECKVQKEKEFRFATCFICKEPGHIARQCPDNPKGLYPNGGSCKLCGDVTHLRKDCPTVINKKEGSNIKLQTLDSGENIEDVEQGSNKFTPTETSKKPKKIKF